MTYIEQELRSYGHAAQLRPENLTHRILSFQNPIGSAMSRDCPHASMLRLLEANFMDMGMIGTVSAWGMAR